LGTCAVLWLRGLPLLPTEDLSFTMRDKRRKTIAAVFELSLPVAADVFAKIGIKSYGDAIRSISSSTDSC
jgi:hypothetical protein